MSEFKESNDSMKCSFNRYVYMVGAFPPPVHGMAAVNLAVYKYFIGAGAEPTVINVAAKNLERSLIARFGRLPQVVRGIGSMLFSDGLRGVSLYMSVSGGLGQVYEILFLLLARLSGMRVYLHHHCFAYLDRRSLLTGLLTTIAGKHAVHITLSTGMADLLHAKYLSTERVMAVSNTVFVEEKQSKSVRVGSSLNTIGFISNISAEKGIFDFLDLVAAYEAENLPINAKIAGPCQDVETEKMVMQRLGELTSVEYLGPQYGDDKESFFESIDVLIFPTRYVNEAEPLTIHEAMKYGIPVISYGRGCISEIINPECGLVIDHTKSFALPALEQIKRWLNEPDVYKKVSYLAAECFAESFAKNTHRWHKLLNEIVDNKKSD